MSYPGERSGSGSTFGNRPLSSRTLSGSGSRSAGGLVIVTGFAQLDAKLRSLPAAIQRKFVRGALRKSAKRVVQEFKRIVHAEAHDTGTLERAAKVRSLKRSRTRIGVAMFIDREKLFAEYATKHGGKTPHPAAGEKDPFYYPAVIEFGSENRKPIRPMRRALYDHESELRAYFRDDTAQFIAENKVTTKL